MTDFERTAGSMSKRNKVAKNLSEAPKVATRERSDLIVPEFGGDGRCRDNSLIGSAASSHWNADSSSESPVCFVTIATCLVLGTDSCTNFKVSEPGLAAQAQVHWEEGWKIRQCFRR